ncbi:MAG: prepilin peptidase [Phycisphaerae bacterium]|nr:prepilin peptidase [Phycisphaerae bacterium]
MGVESYWQVTAVMLTPLVLWASWIDYKERRVPNWLNALIAVIGFGVQAYWFGLAGLQAGLLGGLAGLALLIVPWIAYMMGAGDVKLLAAAGVWMGASMIFWAFVIGAIIGAAASLAMIAAARRWCVAGENFQMAAIKLSSPKLFFSDLGSVKSMGTRAQLIPYGVPLTAGMLVVMGLKVCGIW